MNETINWKLIILIVAVIYLISPIDLMSFNGLDDLVVLGTALIPFFKKTLN